MHIKLMGLSSLLIMQFSCETGKISGKTAEISSHVQLNMLFNILRMCYLSFNINFSFNVLLLKVLTNSKKSSNIIILGSLLQSNFSEFKILYCSSCKRKKKDSGKKKTWKECFM